MGDKGLIREPSLLSLWLENVEAPLCPGIFYLFFFPLMWLHEEVMLRLSPSLSEG